MYIFLAIVATVILAYILFLIGRREYRKFCWAQLTGHRWQEPLGGFVDPWKYQDGVLTVLAKAGQQDRFEEARQLASKLELGHPWTSRPREIPPFGVYASR